MYLGWRDVVPSLGFIHYNHQLWYFFHHSIGDNMPLPGWVVYTLPQGLWALGLSLFIGGIWYKGPLFMGYIWLSLSMMAVLLWEVFQRAGFIAGTFSWLDVVIGICGVGVGIVFFTFKKYES